MYKPMGLYIRMDLIKGMNFAAALIAAIKGGLLPGVTSVGLYVGIFWYVSWETPEVQQKTANNSRYTLTRCWYI